LETFTASMGDNARGSCAGVRISGRPILTQPCKWYAIVSTSTHV